MGGMGRGMNSFREQQKSHSSHQTYMYDCGGRRSPNAAWSVSGSEYRVAREIDIA